MVKNDIYPGRQWKDRLAMWAAEFPRHYYIPVEELKISGFYTYERLSLHQALEQAEKTAFPVPVGTPWGKKWEYGWFFTEWTVPESLNGKRLIFLPGVGEEMLIWVNGREKGSVDKHHGYVTLVKEAAAGERIRIAAECYAGHGPRREDGCFCRKGEEAFSEADTQQLVTAASFAAVWQEEIFQVAMDYLTLYSLMSRLPARSLRLLKVTEGLKFFTTLVDFELPEEALAESLIEADKVLKPLLACTNGSTAPEFVAFGQSHLDLAWLWTQEETRRKAARTYCNQLELMEEYPAYKFLLCEPPILEYLKESYPAVWQRVREKVKDGQIIPEGAIYVECDTNMTCGESLARQFLYGKEWFMEEFSVDSQVAWMPDTFGFSPALPQILVQCGIPYITTQKLVRQDPECEPFPYNDFWWQGIDGSRVLGHLYKENNAVFSPAALIERWEDDRIQQTGMEGMLFPFGYGDGGGGPTRELLEAAARCADLEGAPRVSCDSPVAYFEALRERGTDNIFTGELYLSWHRGTYTAQARTKKGVRRAECLLKEAEYWNTLLAVWQSADIQEGQELLADTILRAGTLKQLWKRLLFQEFHDILPGTGIARVHEEAESELNSVAEECEDLLQDIFAALLKMQGEMKDVAAGEAPGVMPVKKENSSVVSEKAESCEESPGIGIHRETGHCYLQSESIYAELDKAGRVLKLHGRKSGAVYEAEDRPMNVLRLYRNVNSYYDAWEIGSMYEQEEEQLDTGNWELIKGQYEGRPAWYLKGIIKESPFSQIIYLSGDGTMLEFHMSIDWQERHRMLKVDFPAGIRAGEVTGEIAFGAYRQPATRSYQWEKDRYEVCGHRYSVLEDGRSGIAVMNDCKYGYSTKEDQISLTLLRSPLMPDQHADQGLQEFAYACYPFEGAFQNAGVVQKAIRFNRDSHISSSLLEQRKVLHPCFRLFDMAGTGEEADLPCHVVLEAVKLAEDGSGKALLRLYESAGCPQRVKITFALPLKGIEETNILEKNRKKLVIKKNSIILEFRAFEIKTLQFTPAVQTVT